MKSLDGQTAGMAFDPDQRRTALRAFLAKHEELNANRWEKQASLGEGTLRKFLAGATKTLTDETYTKLQDAASSLLGRSVGLYELQGGDGQIVPLPRRNNASGAATKLERANMARDESVTTLVMWKSAHGASGRLGAFVLSSEPIAEIPRPEQLEKAKRAFCFKLLDNANGPGYRAGHVVAVDPDVGAGLGDMCVFTDESKLGAGAQTIAAFLRSVTATHWIITQNEIDGEQQLCRLEFPQAWPVVVHYPHAP